MTKYGRSLWLRKQSPNNVNVIGYRRFEGGNAALKPIRVKVTEIVDD